MSVWQWILMALLSTGLSAGCMALLSCLKGRTSRTKAWLAALGTAFVLFLLLVLAFHAMGFVTLRLHHGRNFVLP